MRITSYSSKFWLWAPVVALLGLVVWAAGYWYVAAGALEKKLAAIKGHEALPGITLSFDSALVSGFPFNLDVVFTGLAVSGEGAHGPLRWTSEKFALHRLTYGPAQDIYEAAGSQSLSWTDGGGRSHAVKFLPGALRASIVADRRGLTRFDLDMVAAGGTDEDGAPFTINGAQFHMRRDPKSDALDLMLKGDEITAKDDIAHLFGDHIKSLSLYATLNQGSAFAPLLAGQESWSKAAADWRAKGGTVVIGPVTIDSSGLKLSANLYADSGDDLRGLLSPLY